MKKIFLVLTFFTIYISQSQIHEIGPYLGGSNFIGDVGKTNYINPNELAYGIIYKWNKSPRHSYRFTYIQSKITAQDENSKERARKTRDLDFENNVKDFTLGMEFNFFEFNLHNLDNATTPYVATGVSYTIYDGLFYKNKTATSDSQHTTLGIPITVGIKTRIATKLVLAAEVSARYTFADDIDGSFPTNEKLQQLKFGNINSNDWLMFSGITLTYTFGEKPCYCRQK